MCNKLVWQGLGVLALAIALTGVYFDIFYGWVGVPVGGAILMDTVINNNLYK